MSTEWQQLAEKIRAMAARIAELEQENARLRDAAIVTAAPDDVINFYAKGKL